MLRLGTPAKSLVVVVCRRCLSVAAAAPAASATCPTTMARMTASLQLAWQHPRGGHQQRRGYVSLGSLRAWFTEGPEAAAPVSLMPPPPPPPPPVDAPVVDAASSFFVQDAPGGLLDASASSTSAGAEQLLSAIGEPTFASLGLGTGFWPSSLQLKLLEFMHVTVDVPWWLCVVLMGIGVRLLLLVPNMHLQRLMRADLPMIRGIIDYGERMRFAVRSGNMPESLRLNQQVLEMFPEMISPMATRQFMRRMTITMIVNGFALAFVQASTLRAIYRAASLPVDSFQQGGLLWVSDLTCIDPYFLLPAAVTALLMLNVRFYFKSVTAANEMVLLLRPVAYTILPVFVFTCLLNFPGANMFYLLATGCTAQLLHRINSTEAAKDFWKARIGLPRLEEVPRPPTEEATKAMERIRTKLMPALNARDYQATRPTDTQVPKTFRLRPQQQRKNII